MGNPKKSPEQLRRHTVKVSLNDAELEQLTQKAQGRSLATYCREAALGENAHKNPLQMVPSVNRSKWMELGRVGSNLNQIARHLNRGEWIEAEAIAQTVETTLDELRQLRQEIGQAH